MKFRYHAGIFLLGSQLLQSTHIAPFFSGLSVDSCRMSINQKASFCDVGAYW